jgi:hypothetical protein
MGVFNFPLVLRVARTFHHSRGASRSPSSYKQVFLHGKFISRHHLPSWLYWKRLCSEGLKCGHCRPKTSLDLRVQLERMGTELGRVWA